MEHENESKYSYIFYLVELPKYQSFFVINKQNPC